jgi:hypothetical protein
MPLNMNVPPPVRPTLHDAPLVHVLPVPLHVVPLPSHTEWEPLHVAMTVQLS